MSHGSCTSCGRRYRSKAAREAAENYKRIHAQLRSELIIESLGPDKQTRKHLASEEYRQTGEYHGH